MAKRVKIYGLVVDENIDDGGEYAVIESDDKFFDSMNYAEHWAGECRNDPEDGNAYVLRAIETRVPDMFYVRINDIFGGHSRLVPVDQWVTWEQT
jgi:hypothetical protein